MITDTTFDSFYKTNYDAAIGIAINQLGAIKGKMTNWDRRIDEDTICEESVMNAMQTVYKKYTPSNGNIYGFLKTVIHNEMVDLLKAEKKSLAMVKDISPREEKDYTWDQMAVRIPDSDMKMIMSRLRYAIGELQPMDQAILSFYIENPETYIQKSVDKFNIKPNNVSLRKNRAMEILPELMGITPREYFDMFEEHQGAIGFGFMTTKTQEPKQVNFVYPEFNLETTVTRIANIIRMLKGEI